ncbi:phosphate signaling complex PhoU family protein [Natrialba swarupiae]|uniref:Phosphate uptake regulator PhoU n=1 Tax=Natrialba swarupiae TaxID=2448032 RepID=A0A5D5ALV0_9EURY|nr:phosphate uptake regulator PhoU [Natrialba swarupiae]TYT62696.1 phosphate uptake regulator PhoU [Natrialba swarupiae]
METRKVQLSGGTTYTVSLPKQWADEHNIDSGSVLYLYPDDRSLLLETVDDGSERAKTARIDISQQDEQPIRQSIRAAYLAGYDEITLLDHGGETGRRRHVVTTAVDRLCGLEIIEGTENTITLRNLLDSDTISVRKSTLRLQLITLAMFRDAVEAIVDSDVELASQVSDRTSEADKHFALIERQFRRSLSDLQEADRLGCSRVELFGYYRAATHLDRIAGCATSMAEHVDQFQTPLPATFSRAFQEHASETKHLQERACNTVFRTSESAESHAIVRDCTRQRKAIDVERERLFDHEDSSVASSVNSLFDYLDRTVRNARAIAEVGVRITIDDAH